MNPDNEYLELLKTRNISLDKRFMTALNRFYSKLDKCEIKWISQSTPMGFGHALLSAKNFVGKNSFLLHTGDAYFPNYQFLSNLLKNFHKNNSSGLLLLQRKKNLEGYGIAQIKKNKKNNYVINVQEKPKIPLSNLAILPLYLFKPNIFTALKKTSKGYNDELQVTDAIKTLLNSDEQISAEIYSEKYWYDIGTPQNYFLALKHSFQNSTKSF
jgi:dTDP-glucose pyrophosphorylase